MTLQIGALQSEPPTKALRIAGTRWALPGRRTDCKHPLLDNTPTPPGQARAGPRPAHATSLSTWRLRAPAIHEQQTPEPAASCAAQCWLPRNSCWHDEQTKAAGHALARSPANLVAASSASTAPMRQQKAARWASVVMRCWAASCSSSVPCAPAACAAAAAALPVSCRCAPGTHHGPCIMAAALSTAAARVRQRNPVSCWRLPAEPQLLTAVCESAPPTPGLMVCTQHSVAPVVNGPAHHATASTELNSVQRISAATSLQHGPQHSGSQVASNACLTNRLRASVLQSGLHSLKSESAPACQGLPAWSRKGQTAAEAPLHRA